MSLVGPRPLPLRDYQQLEAWHRKRYIVLPGITGLWQISGRSNLTFDDLVRLDFYYIENWSIWLDISILVKTLPAVVSRSRRVPSRTAAVTRAAPTAPSSPLPMLSGVKAPKILAVASAVDLDFRYGCTPAWWQLWKGLYEVGVDLIVTPVPRPAGRVAVVADGAEPDLGRGRELRRRPRRARAAEGRQVPAPRRGVARTRPSSTRRRARRSGAG